MNWLIRIQQYLYAYNAKKHVKDSAYIVLHCDWNSLEFFTHVHVHTLLGAQGANPEKPGQSPSLSR